MPPPRDPDPTEATLVPDMPTPADEATLAPRKPAEDEVDATLMPPRDPGPSSGPSLRPGPDSAEVLLVPERRGDPSTDSRIRLAALLGDDDDLDDVTLPPPRRPEPGAATVEAVEQTLLGPVDDDKPAEPFDPPPARPRPKPPALPVVAAEAVEQTLLGAIPVDPEATRPSVIGRRPGKAPPVVVTLKPPPAPPDRTHADPTRAPSTAAAARDATLTAPLPRTQPEPDQTQVPSTIGGPHGVTLTAPPRPGGSEASATEADVTRVPAGASAAGPGPTIDLRAPGHRSGTHARPADGLAGRYETQALHAKGGLGEVHTARDVELNREVALKRIQSRYADDPASRRRFLAEAEITARLDHPGVVPVYGLVADGRGRPCYAMRFIRGQSYRDEIDQFYRGTGGRKQETGRTDPATPPPGTSAAPAPGTTPPADAADDRRVGFRQLLGRFVAVCQAVGYAHSKHHVIHRDIKPANIMVGEYGETLVVDWGLAKVVGDATPDAVPQPGANGTWEKVPAGATQADDATAMGVAVGTPAYMAPEQAAGRIDLLGPKADIYSLGATLYYVLAGRAPFSGSDPTETMRMVQQGSFVPPATVNPAAPKALEAVCLKAMAVKMDDRYATALDLAADVERWLSDEPVSAYPEPWHVRLGRWARRNPSRIAASVSVLGAGLVAAGAIAFVVNAARVDKANQLEETKKARDAAEKAETEAKASEARATKSEGETKKANADLKVQIGKTEKALSVARVRFKAAADGFRLIVADIQAELGDRAGTGELRKKLLQRAEEGLAKIVESAADDDVDPLEANQLLTSARTQMGDIYLALGETDKAAAQYEEAAKVAEARVKAAAKNDPTAGRELADLHDRRAEVADRRGNLPLALDFSQKALDAREADARAADPDARRALAATLDRRAALFLEQGQVNKAKEYADRAADLRAKLFADATADAKADAADPESPRNRAARDLATSLEQQAAIARDLGATAEALKLADRAVELRGEVAKRFEAEKERTGVVARLVTEHAAAFTARGDVHLATGRAEAAYADFDAARKLLDRARRLDPNSVRVLADTVGVLGRLTLVEVRLGLVKNALKSARDAVDAADRLARADPTSAFARRELAAARGRLGDALLANNRAVDALAEYAEARDLLGKLVTDDPTSARAKAELAAVTEQAGQAYLDAGDPATAVDTLTAAVKLREAVAGLDKDSAEAKRKLAAALTRRADAHLRADDPAAAEADAEAGYRLLAKVAADDRTNRQARRELAGAFARRGDVADRRGLPTAALIYVQQSVDESAALAELPTDVLAKEELAAGLERLADAYRFGGFRAARQDAEFRALNLRVKVVEADPHNLIANRALMTSYRRLGELVLEERNLSEARKRFEQALAVPAKLGEFADDPVFAPEKARIADRLLLCTLLEKGTANLDVVWAAPARVRGAALAALLEPGPGDQPEHVDRVVRMLWRHVQARDAEAAAALAGVGLDPRLADRTRGAEELYRLGRACAWLATRAPAGVDRQQYEGAALYYLGEARKRGFRDAGRVRADPVWAPLKYSLYFPADLRPADAAPPAK